MNMPFMKNVRKVNTAYYKKIITSIAKTVENDEFLVLRKLLNESIDKQGFLDTVGQVLKKVDNHKLKRILHALMKSYASKLCEAETMDVERMVDVAPVFQIDGWMESYDNMTDTLVYDKVTDYNSCHVVFENLSSVLLHDKIGFWNFTHKDDGNRSMSYKDSGIYRISRHIGAVVRSMDHKYCGKEAIVISRKTMFELCPSCAEKMKVAGISKIKVGDWSKLPKGWTQDSVRKFWKTLTGDVKHKVTKCHKEMTSHFGDKGAWGFCAGLADMVEGTTKWRGEK